MQNLKKIFYLCFILMLGFAKSQDSVVDLLSIPGPIEYNGNEFFLSWSKQNSKTLSIQQFLPRDETIDDFTELLNFSYFNKEIDIELAVRQKVEAVQHIEKTDKFAKVNVAESPDGTEYIVDYTVSAEAGKAEPYVEYNVYRFKNYDNAGVKSFLILSYAKRIYGEDFKGAFKSLMKQRDDLMTAMIEYKIPQITLVNQGNSEIKK